MTTTNLPISLTIPVSFATTEGGPYDLTGYTLVQHQLWQSYTGSYDLVSCKISGPPEQIAPVSLASKVVEIFAEKFKTGGFTPLEISVYANWSPTLYTDYVVEFKTMATPTTAKTSLASAEMHQVQAVAAIIAIIMIALAVIALSLVAWKVADVVGSIGSAAGGLGWVAILVIFGIVAYGWMEGKKPKKQKEGTT